jgi:GTPase SAR1 family protein
LAIIGNKVDLETTDVVSYEEASGYAKELGAIFHYTSAKDGKGIQELFGIISEKLVEMGSEGQGGKEKLRKKKKDNKKCC